MKKIFFVFSIFAFIILFSTSIFAAPAAPSPVCKINAKIIKVDYIKAHFQEDKLLPCNPGGRIPAKYLLHVRINSVSSVTSDDGIDCTKLYPINSVQTLTIFESNIKRGNVFRENQIIEGSIHFDGDECDSGVYLINYNITDSCPELTPPAPDWCKGGKIIPGEIDEKGCQQPPLCLIEPSELVTEDNKLFVKTEAEKKQINVLPNDVPSKATEISNVKEIKLKEEDGKLIYSVKGTKNTRILFIIPVSMEIETKINAESDEVISIKKPWWSFLAW